jgi:hypothetical protein
VIFKREKKFTAENAKFTEMENFLIENSLLCPTSFLRPLRSLWLTVFFG